MDEHVRHALDILHAAVRAGKYPTFSSSMGQEDQVLAHLIVKNRFPITIFTIDTGRLPPETYDLIRLTETVLETRIDVYFPDYKEVEHYVRLHGINGFHMNRAQRLDCCRIRKVNVLRRALSGKTAWLTGIRREQSPERQEVAELEFDANHQILKANPLVAWTTEHIGSYIEEHAVPINPLHAQGYRSLGCAPCTRPVRDDESLRAGRWWWEADSTRECGLHTR